MARRGQQTVLSQGLDHSPSPPTVSHPSCDRSRYNVELQLRKETQNCGFRQHSILPAKRKLPDEKEDGQEADNRHEFGSDHSFHGTMAAIDKPMGSALSRSSRTLTNLGESSRSSGRLLFMKDLPKNDFKLDRSRQSLPAFTANNSKVLMGGQTASRFSNRFIKDDSRSSNTENTLNRVGELSLGMMPAARSSAIHDSFSTNRSADRSSALIGMQRQFTSSISANAPLQPGNSKSRSKYTASSHRAVRTTNQNQSQQQNESSFSFMLPQSGSNSSLPYTPITNLTVTDQPAEMEGDSDICKTIVSVIWHKGLLGACIYSTDSMRLQLLQDIPEDVNFLTTTQLFMQTQPDVIITGAKQDARFLETLKDLANGEEEDRHQQRLQTLANEELGYEVCRKRLVMTCENSLARGKADADAFIKSTVNLNFVNMVRAAGGLLRHLETSAVNLAMNFDKDLSVLSVELYVMNCQVWIDANTFSGLRILHLADHPSTSLGNRYTREGFSLFESCSCDPAVTLNCSMRG